MTLKETEEKIFKVLMLLSLIAVILPLLVIIGVTIYKGGGVFLRNPWAAFTSPGPRYLLGGEGGFLHALAGSFYMAVPATVLATLGAILIASYLQSDYSTKKFSDLIRTSLDILWGTPSIVYGIFILTIMIALNQRGCLLAGIAALTLLELPVITRYADEAISSVPEELKEATYSMGFLKFEVAKVTMKYALPGITAGVLIGLGRGLGDAASIVFTAGAGNSIPGGLFHTATALPVLIFQQAGSFYPSVREDAYAAALTLIVLILLLNILSRIFQNKFNKYRKGDS